jgi:hypothetical protein
MSRDARLIFSSLALGAILGATGASVLMIALFVKAAYL